MKISTLYEKVLSVPKSLWVSMHYFPLRQAVKLPIIVRYNAKLLEIKGKVLVNRGGVKTGMLSIGFGQVGIFDKRYERSILQISGTIVLNGKAILGHGSRLCVGKEGIVTFGNKFTNTANMSIVCVSRITFGDNVLTSWNTLVMDTDWHHIENAETHTVYPCTKEIIIGKKVWICTRSVVLKGSVIPDGCIIGANSLVSKQFNEENVLIAGNPAKVMKRNITRHMQ